MVDGVIVVGCIYISRQRWLVVVGGEDEGAGEGAIRGKRVIIRATLTVSETETESVAIDR